MVEELLLLLLLLLRNRRKRRLQRNRQEFKRAEMSHFHCLVPELQNNDRECFCRENMLPIDSSPSKEKRVKKQRVLDWVVQSKPNAGLNMDNIAKRKQTPSIKRKMPTDENRNDQANAVKRRKPINPSKPMSPKKFYLPNEEEESNSSKAFPLPSTPESKKSTISSANCFSPDKLDGIFVRGGNSAIPIVMSDSESAKSTPVKQQEVFVISCGLDSPETDDDFKTPRGGTKKFSKLGHRWNNRTLLQQFRDGIKKDTRKISLGSAKTAKLKLLNLPPLPVKVKEPTIDTPTQDLAGRLEPSSQSEADYCSEVTTILSESSPTVSSRAESTNEMDRTNDTLTDSSGDRLKQKKILPLFQRQAAPSKDSKDQLVIDAGQKDFDEARQCIVCRMIYTKGDPDDEAVHRQFHSRLIQALRFQGWKKENVAARCADHRIISIDDTAPPHCIKKVQALKVVLDQELGYVQEVCVLKPNRKIYLYVGDDKMIKGVCIAESISRASRLDGDRASVQCVQASVGVNRLWVYAKYRREGVATKLLDCVRSTFGPGLCVPRADMAFSDPTSHGKMFAAKYTGTNHFLVYKP